MNGTSHSIRRTLQGLVLTASVAAIVVPSAFAGSNGGPGLVPSKLGSPDPRESQGTVLSAGLVPSRLGSQDPRDTASQAIAESSIVASELGTPDTRDAVGQSSDGDFMFRDYFRGTHYVGQPDWLRALQIRGEGMNKLSADGKLNSAGTVVASSKDGFDFGQVGIGIVGVVCGLLLLTALGIGARQVRHTRHRLGSA
jgi:hypothetical protein